MINLIITLVIAAAGWVLTALIFNSVWTGIIPFFVLGIAAFIILNRRTSKHIVDITKRAQQMMQSLANLPSEQARKNLLDKTVDVIKEGYKYKNYQFFIEKNLNSQIGMIYYVQKRFKDAAPYLKNAFPQPGTALAMYACIMFREKNENEMVKQFEKALRIDRKTPLLWNLYAWCLNEFKKRDEAIRVLNRCLQYCPNDKLTRDNIDLLKNSGRIKMRSYNEQWYQFWLEEPPRQQIIQQMSPYSKRAMYGR